MFDYKIAEARRARGWSQRELAERIGTTQQQVARYESGENDVKSSALIKLSSALGVTISYLLGLDSPPGSYTLSHDEGELVDCYRSADGRGRENILDVARRERGTAEKPMGGGSS